MSRFSSYLYTLTKSPWWGVLHELLPDKLDQAAQKAARPSHMHWVPQSAQDVIAARRCEPNADEQDPVYVKCAVLAG
jgi:hypothetical protein